MSVKRTSMFKLSQTAKRFIATMSADKRAALKKAWVDGETSASYRPKKSSSSAFGTGSPEL